VSASPPRLGFVELLDRDGAVAHRVPVTRWPVTVGRALDCDVVLDDPHAAGVHATLDAADGRARLHVGDSLNGLRLGRRVLAGGAQAVVDSGAEWQIGRTRQRLRLAGEVLAPELPLALAPPVDGRWLVAGLVLLLAWLLGSHWIESDPGDPLGGYLSVLVSAPVALAVWCFLWALGSKLFARHFDFLPHLRFALGLLLLALLLDALLPLVAFALSWEWLGRASALVVLALGCVLLHGHLSLVLPTRRHALAIGFATMFVVGAGLKLTLDQQRNGRWFAPLYLDTLGPPALRLAPLATPEGFIDAARTLRAPLDARARDPDAPGWLPVEDEE
jgi:hypothetical protein